MTKSRNPLRRIYDWTLSLAERKTSSWWLGLISFSEASFFPIPPDVLLIPLCLGAIRRALKFALICSIASVLGGLAGYAIGFYGWETLEGFFYDFVPGFTPEKFEEISGWYEEWGWYIVFLAGFTPIPYKVFTVASGVMDMALIPFLLASAVSRSARFFLVAILISKFGEPMKERIDRHFNKCALAFGVLLVGGFLLLKVVLH
ncbi:MAG TPA: cytochrome B [Opitutae bacterium]|nr:cytochrome B [Opitutae bacterium]|tara:strand:- start:1289 stop:1897 length:609 start_codon:yes stop_codon:yes gene_type:complete